MYVDFMSQISVILVILDGMVMPNNLVKPVLQNVLDSYYQVSQTRPAVCPRLLLPG